MSGDMSRTELDDIADQMINDILMNILLLPTEIDREELLSSVLSSFAAETYEDMDDAITNLSSIGLNAMMLVAEMDKDGECRWHQTE